MAASVDIHVILRLRNAKIAKKDPRHQPIIVLSRMNHNLINILLLTEQLG